MKKVLSFFLLLVMLLSMMACSTGETTETPAPQAETEPDEFPVAATDLLAFGDAEKTTITPTLDGEPISVDWYVDCYVSKPNRAEDQLINIYIPENATNASPIIFHVNNAGWQMNSYAQADGVEDGEDYSSTSDYDNIGAALKEGYVIVSYGCRSRSNGLTGAEYLGHSPATMADTKAAIRYLRYNADALPAGDPEHIVITGGSGGGGLSTVIAASGNSPDYYEALYEIGAAGIDLVNGSYVSTLEDDVFAVIAYCPITDLGHADAGYEWLFGNTRAALYEAGLMEYDVDQATVMAASDTLSAMFVEYVNGLGLVTEGGEPLTADNLKACIESLMCAEIEEAMTEVGTEQMTADIEQQIETKGFRFGFSGDPDNDEDGSDEIDGDFDFDFGGTDDDDDGFEPDTSDDDAEATYRENNGWLILNDDGTYFYDIDKHLLYLATYTELKIAPAFSNQGISTYDEQNEDNLFGSRSSEYSPFNAYSWAMDTTENTVGQDNTGLTWEEYMQTEAGQALALQIKMTNAGDYLRDTAGESDSAPYWYVRYGMDDRDGSFAVEAILYYSMLGDETIEDVDFEFTWLEGHGGDYDVQEAYSWLKTALAQ